MMTIAKYKLYINVHTPLSLPEQIRPLLPGQDDEARDDKFWHTCSLHTMLVPHLVPSLTSPGLVWLGPGKLLKDLTQNFFLMGPIQS